MPRKKALSDHSPSKIELKSRFTDAIVDELKGEFNIPPHYPLRERLNDVACWYQYRSQDATPPRSEQKLILEKLREQASALEETLSKLGRVEALRLEGALLPERKPHFSLEQIALDITELKNIARIATERIPSISGRPEDEAFSELIQSLRTEYQRATGDDRKYTYSSVSDKCIDPASNFVGKCLLAMGIHKSPGSITSAIKKVINTPL